MDLKHNQEYQDYYQQVCSQIKCRDTRREVMLELENHVRDIAEEYLAQGLEGSKAIAKAIQRMGDAETVGRDLNKVHNPRPEWGVLGLTCLLAAVGLTVIYFIGRATGIAGGPESMFSYSFVFATLGLVLAGGLYFLDYRKIQPWSWHLYLTVVVLLGFAVLVGGSTFGSSLGKLVRAFPEISPFLLGVSLAGMFRQWRWEQTKYLMLGMGLLLVPLYLMYINFSSSAALVYATVFITLMYVSGAKLWQLLFPVGLATAGISLSYITTPYKLQRLLAMLNPSSDPTGHGWLSLQLDNLRRSAGLFGQGINTEPWFSQIGPHTELILSYIVYAFGWLAGVALIIAIAAFVFRMARIVLKVKNPYGKQLISGITAAFAVRFLWNILMNLGLLPIAGIGLPFISFGAVDILMNMAMIGLVMSVYRHKSLGSISVNAISVRS